MEDYRFEQQAKRALSSIEEVIDELIAQIDQREATIIDLNEKIDLLQEQLNNIE